MHLLTLRIETGSECGLDWSMQRRVAQAIPPAIPGLIVRTWSATRRAAEGRYVFKDRDSLDAFRADPQGADPAAREILALGARTDTVHALGTTVDATGDMSIDVTDDTAIDAITFDRPVFIVSAPRAGSTLLFELLGACDALWTIGREMQSIVEAIPALHLATRGYESQVLGEDDADVATVRALRAGVLSELRSADGRLWIDRAPAVRPKRVRFLDKTPENALRLPFLRRAFPDARFVFLHRDLRQNVSSMVEAWQHPGFVAIPELPGWSRGSWCFLLPPGWRDLDGASWTEIAGFQWQAANRAILQELEGLDHDRWIAVSYADLIAAPKAQVERICAFCGVDPGARLQPLLEQPLRASATTIRSPSPIKWKSNRLFDTDQVRGLQPLAGRIRTLHSGPGPETLRTHDATSVRFSCFVDELDRVSTPEDAIVAPSLQVQFGSAPPLHLLRRVAHRERFLSDHPLLWVQDPATAIWSPRWLRTYQAAWCRSLRPGQPPTSYLPAEFRDRLFAAGVLVTQEAYRARQQHGTDLVIQGSTALSRDRFCHLPCMLDPVLTGAIARYHRAMIDSGEWPLGDAQVRRRHGWHNERLARFVHHGLIDFVSKLAGLELKPTYCYTSAYRGGAGLSAHFDREQCDYTLSLMIDEDAPEGCAPWPLWFDSPSGKRSVTLAVGDGVLFRGCELPHWREAAHPDHEQINLLFHFVPADWAGVMD